jgi:nicotinamidase-related amidase
MKEKPNRAPAPGNPENQALLVIDVQQGLFRKSTPIYHADVLLENIQSLVDRAHQAGTPVFYIQHSDPKNLVKGSQDWQLHPQLEPTRMDTIVHKLHGNAFEETKLAELLKSLEIGSLVVCGLVTHGCVRATSLGARKLGYRVVLASDGHSNYSKQAAQLIQEWNQKLSAEAVELKPCAEIAFG